MKKRRVKAAPKACWVAWCAKCGVLLLASTSLRKAVDASEHACSCAPPVDVRAELYVLDRIAMENSDALRAEIARLKKVILIGGALYRAERAAMGVPGGVDNEGQPVERRDAF